MVMLQVFLIFTSTEMEMEHPPAPVALLPGGLSVHQLTFRMYFGILQALPFSGASLPRLISPYILTLIGFLIIYNLPPLSLGLPSPKLVISPPRRPGHGEFFVPPPWKENRTFPLA